MARLKKTETALLELAERLSLPEEALLGAARLTVVAGRKTLIENHRGILAYGPERVEISTGRGKISLNGNGLHLLAMNRSELLIGGAVQNVEWE